MKLFLNKKGNCPFCEKKPRKYTNKFLYCPNCGRFYSMLTGQEVPNVFNYSTDGEFLKGAV